MSCGKKSAHQIIDERLAHWYLFIPRTFNISVEQLAELYKGLSKPARLGYGVERQQAYQLIAHIKGLLKAKNGAG
jgi:hypothetical protein